MNKSNTKLEKMTKEPVEKLVVSLAIPTIISMLITTFYNLVDTKFIGSLGISYATAAVGIVYSLMNVIQAVGFFCGHGSGNYISRALGEKKINEAEKMASTGFYFAIVLGGLLCIFGQLFAKPLAVVLGARDPITLKYTLDYMRIILIGAPFMTAQLVLNNQLRFQGNAIFAMAGIASGGVVNIGLDALFINIFEMEVAGAALATLLGQIISFIVLYFGVKKSDNIKIKLKNFTPNKMYLLEITRGGTPSLFRQCMGSLSTSILNNVAFTLGTEQAQAAMGIVSRLTMFISSAMIGFGQGFQPVCGFNYGAGLYKRVRKAFMFCMKVAVVALTILAIVGYIFAPYIISFMQSGDGDNIENIISIGTTAIRRQLIFLPLMSFVVLSNMMLQTIGDVYRASLLALCRQGLMLIPSIYILSYLFSLNGFLWAQGVADVISFAIAIPVTIPILKKFKNNKNDDINSCELA